VSSEEEDIFLAEFTALTRRKNKGKQRGFAPAPGSANYKPVASCIIIDSSLFESNIATKNKELNQRV
jgi:hypothetical protein